MQARQWFDRPNSGYDEITGDRRGAEKMTDTGREVIMPEFTGVSEMAKYRKYSKDFKLEAAKLVTKQGYSYQQAE